MRLVHEEAECQREGNEMRFDRKNALMGLMDEEAKRY